mmetsp:Transcript_18233/g.55695  ORF Transcript_18233/g.55695 Transcript_18233/m.55695 type:complete len:275 (+) Transcript_18233:1220-2044(+)
MRCATSPSSARIASATLTPLASSRVDPPPNRPASSGMPASWARDRSRASPTRASTSATATSLRRMVARSPATSARGSGSGKMAPAATRLRSTAPAARSCSTLHTWTTMTTNPATAPTAPPRSPAPTTRRTRKPPTTMASHPLLRSPSSISETPLAASTYRTTTTSCLAPPTMPARACTPTPGALPMPLMTRVPASSTCSCTRTPTSLASWPPATPATAVVIASAATTRLARRPRRRTSFLLARAATPMTAARRSRTRTSRARGPLRMAAASRTL